MIDAFASFPHYAEHLTPILDALPDDLRGRVYGPRRLSRMGEIGGHRVLPTDQLRRHGEHPLLVASYTDLPTSKRPKVLIEHGAGQTYIDADDHASYAGGAGRELAGLFLCPNEHVAFRNHATYPDATVAIIGSPRLDRMQAIPYAPDGELVVAVAFHWDCKVTVESGTAFGEYAAAVIELAQQYKVLGHGHPRARDTLGPWYRHYGIETCWSTSELLARAHVLVADNTSLMYEWAACDRPVVALNASWWRRDVEHGLRFWSHVPGGQISDPADLVAAVELASVRDRFAEKRKMVTDHVYGGFADGLASERAAAVILAWMEGKA